MIPLTKPRNYEIKINYTEQIIRVALRRYWMRAVGNKLILSFLVMAGLTAFLYAHNHQGWYFKSLLATLCLGIIYFPLVYYLNQRQTGAFMRKMPARRITLRLTDEGIETHSDFGTSMTKWQKIGRIWRFREVWLLFYAKKKFTTIPTSAMTSPMAEAIARKVMTFGGKIS